MFERDPNLNVKPKLIGFNRPTHGADQIDHNLHSEWTTKKSAFSSPASPYMGGYRFTGCETIRSIGRRIRAKRNEVEKPLLERRLTPKNPSFTFGAMAAPLLLLLLIPIAAAASDASNASSAISGLSAYEVLEGYNFPVGLLPNGAMGYDLDPATGKFSAYFEKTCSFSIQSYKIRYQRTITGLISTNRLTDLRGVSVKVLLFWINIVEVLRDGDQLDFSVGILSADFPIDNFYVCPQCGCGLNCNAIGRRTKEGLWPNLRSDV